MKKTAITDNNKIVTNNNQQKQWTKKSRKVNSKKNTLGLLALTDVHYMYMRCKEELLIV